MKHKLLLGVVLAGFSVLALANTDTKYINFTTSYTYNGLQNPTRISNISVQDVPLTCNGQNDNIIFDKGNSEYYVDGDEPNYRLAFSGDYNQHDAICLISSNGNEQRTYFKTADFEISVDIKTSKNEDYTAVCTIKDNPLGINNGGWLEALREDEWLDCGTNSDGTITAKYRAPSNSILTPDKPIEIKVEEINSK